VRSSEVRLHIRDFAIRVLLQLGVMLVRYRRLRKTSQNLGSCSCVPLKVRPGKIRIEKFLDRCSVCLCHSLNKSAIGLHHFRILFG